MTLDKTKVLVDVAVSLPTSQIDRLFTYLLPPHLQDLPVGTPVVVPFGPRAVTGLILRRKNREEYPGDPQCLKPVLKVLSEVPLLPRPLVELALWLQDYYCTSPWEAVRAMLPGKIATRATPRTKMVVELAIGRKEARQLAEEWRKRAPVQARVLEELARQEKEVAAATLCQEMRISQGVLQTLAGKGLIRTRRVPLRVNPWQELEERPSAPHNLSPEQEKALETLRKILAQGEPATILIHGVTGSGKTEVYLRAVQEALHRHRTALVLVPEIALTPQTAELFRGWFGEKVAIFHSRLGEAERQAEWWRIRRGEAVVVLGTRSAVFAPLEDLGLIILDEEHETSYKQAESPRYHGRRVAEERARREGAILVLGSATPAVETYYQAENGQYHLVTLTKRVEGRLLPEIRVVDMRQELAEGNRSIFSRPLREAIAQRLGRHEQVILFINRRGFASAVLCRDCGQVIECRFCRVAMTYHADQRRLVCHYCNYQRPLPETCPGCGSSLIRPLGAGTERVQEAVRLTFPEARVVRMDMDTTRQKGAHARFLRDFRRGEYDVLVGTQMVAKGLDLPRVTLVGVVLAETSLYLPDFRAGERTFQLLSQVSGRAGRGDLPGEVIIQTYNPDHYAIQAAARHDWQAFYRQELAFRERAGYPPFGSLALLTASGPEETWTRNLANGLAAFLKEELTSILAAEKGTAEILGPTPAPLSRLRGRYRFHIIIKGKGEAPRLLAARGKEAWRGKEPYRLAVDVDPISLL